MTLREILERGEDPFAYLAGDEHDVVTRFGDLLCGAVADRGQRERLLGDAQLEAKCAEVLRERDLIDEARVLDVLAGWGQEVLLDPSLVNRAVAAVADPVLRAELEWIVDCTRRPYPLEVQRAEHPWKCAGCGATFDGGEAGSIEVGHRADYNDEICPGERAPMWCADCLDRAAAEARRMSNR